MWEYDLKMFTIKSLGLRNRSFLNFKSELINLLFPIILAPLVGFELFNFLSVELSRTEYMIYSNVYFFNIGHNFLSLFVLFTMHEFKKWHVLENKKNNINLGVIIILILILNFTMQCLVKGYINIPLIEIKNLSFVYYGLFWSVASQHAIYQVKGFCRLYDRASNRTYTPKELIISNCLFNLILLLQIINVVFPNYFGFAEGVTFAIWFSLCVLLLIFYESFYRTTNFIKFIYMLRLMVIPLIPFSTWATVIYGGFHGIEYLLIYNKMKKTSISHEKSKIGYLAIIILILYSAMTYYYFSHQSDNNVLIFILGAILMSLSLIHYYLDHRFFRMRDISTRQIIGPLLK